MSPERQDGIGWVAPLMATIGLAMALAGASGWGEQPVRDAAPPEAPSSEAHTHGFTGQDAAPPDAQELDDRLVGVL